MVNKIKPGIIPKVGRPGMPFREMENIDMYNNATRSLGVKPNCTFRSPDLYEKRVSYPDAIIDNILALQRVLERGQRSSSSRSPLRGSTSSLRGSNSSLRGSTSSPRSPAPAPSPAPSPSPSRASPSRSTRAPAPAPAPAPRGQVIRTTAHSVVDDDVMKAETERRRKDVSRVSNEAAWVGESRSAQERADSLAVQQWMEAVTGTPFTNSDLWETCKSGKYLCMLVDKIKPGIVNVRKINKSSINMPFKCMENIGFFTQACLDLGVKPNNIFRAPDLYEKRVSYPKAIVNCIMALAKQAEHARGYKGPHLEVERIEGHNTMF
eukprot:TRINITY_DN17122_c0_g1_i3.p1 TRINITY_DN17122_c0_g1~~TRINITY_DN17122_c0_g1_i3.p1  ORF type:complete len:322 (-),score=66.36 TRINITY_DN17122_c0_g1_i3:243-1208(-)